jgi:hypothetical protein
MDPPAAPSPVSAQEYNYTHLGRRHVLAEVVGVSSPAGVSVRGRRRPTSTCRAPGTGACV